MSQDPDFPTTNAHNHRVESEAPIVREKCALYLKAKR